MIITRRKLVAGGLAVVGTSVINPVFAREESPLAGCEMSPLQKFLRIRSSEAGRRTFWSYSGQLLGRVGDTPLRPLFSIIGASQTIANWQDDGTIAYEMVEAGYYGNVETGEIADDPVKNPLTGELVQPEGYLSRQKITFTDELKVFPNPPFPSEQGAFNGSITPPDEKGDRIWMAERLLGMLNETAERSRRVFNSMANFEASRSDVCGPGGFVPATMQYTTLNSFRPWMNMGDAAGNIMSRLNAVKLDHWSDVNAVLRARIETDHSGAFGDA
jgi:hypothetical protein